eukprot:TRINITY_DN56805_c0_g1_i1.p1 TRINITY_DN56805_c0_g1~~TRINITY_DN56805_c0_g1_i1.p1  ORF type:complete len:223 (+),score=31.83 TRINITY_DN56805_c0_g1_i1:125-793(+)
MAAIHHHFAVCFLAQTTNFCLAWRSEDYHIPASRGATASIDDNQNSDMDGVVINELVSAENEYANQGPFYDASFSGESDYMVTCEDFNCPEGRVAKGDGVHITCEASPCKADECCFEEETCEDFRCPPGLKLRPGPENILCSEEQCTKKDCCLKGPLKPAKPAKPRKPAPTPAPTKIEPERADDTSDDDSGKTDYTIEKTHLSKILSIFRNQNLLQAHQRWG